MPFRQHSHNLLGVEDDDPSSDFDDAGPQLMKPVPQDEAKIDHRKKRRNRTTQSCLSCHQNKRKCDRGRPCGRCITLGLTGFCVYEVGEKTRDKDSDEVTSLRNRVAELEGVVRELKNKPQPRWAANAIVAPSSSSTDLAALAVPSTPAPAISFPKESWHVRSARKDNTDRENDGLGSGGGGSEKKKRKLADVLDQSDTYRVKMEAGTSSSYFGRELGENEVGMDEDGQDISSATTLVLGSPLFADSDPSMMLPISPISPARRSSHPNMPLGAGRYGLGLSSSNNGTTSRSVTDPYAGTPFLQDVPASRRSLTGPPPTISSLSRRTALGAANGASASPVPQQQKVNGKPKITGPPCACLADPTATQFVAHLSRNVRSTVEFLETRHRGEDGQNHIDDPMVRTIHDCGVMRALATLDKSIRLSSGAAKRAASSQQSQSQPQSASTPLSMPIPAPLTPPAHLRYLDSDPSHEDIHLIAKSPVQGTSSHSHTAGGTSSGSTGGSASPDGMEMMDPGSPVNLLSEEALHALSSEDHHGNAHPLSSERDVDAHEHGHDGMVTWGEQQQQQLQQQHHGHPHHGHHQHPHQHHGGDGTSNGTAFFGSFENYDLFSQSDELFHS